MAYSLAFSLPGTPVLFYGEEIGMAENLDVEGRLSVRTPMQWSSGHHGGFTTAQEPVRPLPAGDGFSPAEVNVARQRREHGSLLNWMERLIRRRRECPELGFGRCTLLDTGDPAVLAHRVDWEGSSIVAVHSFSGEPRDARVPVGDVEAALDLFADDELRPASEAVEVALEAYGHRWLRLRRPGQRLPP
jgi:glycosidase